MNWKELVHINEERNKERNKPYNPITGEGSNTCERSEFLCDGITKEKINIPTRCFEQNIIQNLNKCGSIKKFLEEKDVQYNSETENLVQTLYHNARIVGDFEYWAATDCTIADLNTEADIKFILNPAQRSFLKDFYEDWFGDNPCRFIITKNRQNGFSTLIEMLFGWIQIVLSTNANSIICAHVENTAKIIRGMYSKMIKKYPKEHTKDNEKLTLTPFEGSKKTRIIKQTGSRISIGSSKEPDALVGDKITLFHASEVGLYVSTPEKTPQQLVQSIQSGIQYRAKTAIIYESTARGVGNFFHTEWVRACNGESGFRPVFVAWFKNLSYQLPVKNYKKFIESMTMEEMELFKNGATLEGLQWRRFVIKQYSDIWRFKQDFPATAEEAFMSTGRRFYPIDDTVRLRQGVCKPAFTGDIYGDAVTGEEAVKNIHFIEGDGGLLKIWFKPEEERYSDRYVVVVDIGGLSEKADRSVICVIDRKDMAKGGVPIVVAEWCGHIDYDILAWKAVQIATIYQNALLVIESNTLEKNKTEGDNFEFILDEIAEYYSNLFCRTPADKIAQGIPARWGFHTNKSTKAMVCSHQRKALRENMYIETCAEAVDEHDQFEYKDDGSLGAIEGAHDDRHITRAIGIWVCYSYLNAPRLRTKIKTNAKSKNKQIGLSSF